MNRNDRRRNDRDRPLGGPSAEGRATNRRVLWIVLAMVFAGIFVARFSDKAAVQPPPPKKTLASLKPRELQDQAAVYGILEGAKAGKEAVAAAKSGVPVNAVVHTTDVGPSEPKVEKTTRGYRVLGAWSENPYVYPRDQTEAEEDAVRVATLRLSEELNGLTPVVEVTGTRVEQPSEQVRSVWKANGLDPDRKWVVVDVQTSEDAIRVERSKQRFGQVGFWVGATFLVLLCGYGFLRLDMWTKGYLTLALAAVALLLVVGGLAGLVTFAR